MASNQVEQYRAASKAYFEARAANSSPRVIAQLKAAMDAAATRTPTGDGRDW